MKIKITKILPCESPLYPTPDKKDYIYGKDNGDVSLPNEYCIEGELLSPIIVGLPIYIMRTVRNGINSFGLFKSSTVKSWDGDIAETMNSKYKVEFLPEN